MNAIEKRIGIALFSFCLLMTLLSSAWRSCSLTAHASIRPAKDSTRLRRKVSDPEGDCKGLSARDGDGARAFSSPPKNSWPCLQNNIKPEDVVSTAFSKPGMSHGRVTKVTVNETLKRLQAHCRKRKLVDARGKEIYFYRLAGCWGNPPLDYQEILQRQSEELQKLRKHYHVIEMTCNPSGGQIQ